MPNKYRYNLETALPINKGIVVYTPDDFNVYLWSDQHFGANECNYPLAEDILTEIVDDPKAKVILGGDLIEAIPVGYKISDRGQRVPPDEQIVESASRLEVIRDKIIVIFKGNHNTQARGESVDSDYVVARWLKVAYKTVPTVVQFKTKAGIVKLAVGHGHRAAQNGDLELHTLRRIFPECDAYALGHNHQLYAKQIGGLTYDENGNEDWDPSWFIRTGNCLNYAEYARFGVYEPQRSGCVRLVVRNGKILDAEILTSDYFSSKKRTKKGKKHGSK